VHNSYINEKQYRDVYGTSPPLANASTPTLIKKQLEMLLDNKIRNQLGNKARQWITKYHSPEIFSQKIKKLYKSILNNEPLEKIRKDLSFEK